MLKIKILAKRNNYEIDIKQTLGIQFYNQNRIEKHLERNAALH